jgi:proline iminopeptidase
MKGPLATIAVVAFLTAGCARTLPFTDDEGRVRPGSIATMEMIEIGGVRQCVWFRGADVTQPAVILLHGGPGVSESALFRRYAAPLEERYLMVYWDQRGAGRSFHAGIDAGSMTIARMEADLDELVEHVRGRFGKERVVLVAHSWGTVLGTRYAARHPAKVAAYVGIAQIADFAEGERISRQWAFERAIERGHGRAIGALIAMGPIPRTVEEQLEKGRWVEAFGGMYHAGLSTPKLIREALRTEEADLVDLWKFGRGNAFSLSSLRDEYSQVDLTQRTSFDVPMIFMLGRHDWHVPSTLAARYLDQISAPSKKVFWFEHSAHHPPYEEPERFVRLMLEEVPDLLLAAHR